MIKHWMKLCLLGLVCAVGVTAAEPKKEAAISGAAEGGFGLGAVTGNSKTQWLLDQAMMKMRYEATEHTAFVFDNVFAFNSATYNQPTSFQNGANFVSKYRLQHTTIDGGVFELANQNAYVEHKSPGVAVAVGHMRTPFGYESTMSRFDMHTYYYSQGYGSAQALGWNYDLGVKVALTDMIPGKLEVAVIDGRNMTVNTNGIGEALSPAGVARYSFEYNAGDWSLTPMASTYLGRWHGSPADVGITAGAMFKMGSIWANAEWIYTSQNLTYSGSANKFWDVYLEPGIDLGVAEVSLKYEFLNQQAAGASSNNDMNIGVAVGKTYSDKLRIRAMFQQSNLSKKLASASSSDFRLLVGTSW